MPDKVIEATAERVEAIPIPPMPECWIVRYWFVSDFNQKVLWGLLDFDNEDRAMAFAEKRPGSFIIHIPAEADNA